MKTALAHASPNPAFGTAPAGRHRHGPSRGHWVDALVTIAIMAWLAAALAGMIGESNVIPSALARLPAVTEDFPTALPREPATPGDSAFARRRLI